MLMPSAASEYKVETLYSGTGPVPEFWRGHLKKVCVHISVNQESFSGTKCKRSLKYTFQFLFLGYEVNYSFNT